MKNVNPVFSSKDFLSKSSICSSYSLSEIFRYLSLPSLPTYICTTRIYKHCPVPIHHSREYRYASSVGRLPPISLPFLPCFKPSPSFTTPLLHLCPAGSSLFFDATPSNLSLTLHLEVIKLYLLSCLRPATSKSSRLPPSCRSRWRQQDDQEADRQSQ